LDNATSKKAASFFLLHHYVRIRDLEKAETLMADLQSQGLAVDQHLYNEMLKLYIAKFDFRKVLSVIRFMKVNQIPFTVLSYNLWMNASIEICGTISSAEKILEEMTEDRNVEVGWSTYVTLANIYIQYGLHDKAVGALLLAEGKLSARKRLGYSFVMTCYASLKNKKGVMRLWELSKRVPYRITCAEYICVMGCFVKMGDLVEAERIFQAWELERRKYDIRVPNILLGAYVRNGLMEKAEKFHLYTLEKGAVPNYKTYEILMEGWVKKQEMEKAVDAMKKGFLLLRSCKWRPSVDIVEVFARYFENEGNVVEFMSLVKVLCTLDMMSLAVYKSLVRTYMNAKVVLPNITLDMIRDGMELDEETEELIAQAKKMDLLRNA
jgi:Pentatricopeptide repeat domain/PPR repeat